MTSTKFRYIIYAYLGVVDFMMMTIVTIIMDDEFTVTVLERTLCLIG